MGNYTGEIFAVATSFMWTVSAMAFESGGKKIGSLSLNLIRLILALVFISIYSYFTRGLAFATDADINTWLWLSLSGIVGLVLGDLMLFRAYILIGARLSMLILSLVPPITAFLGWLILGETLKLSQIFAMLITLVGICIVLLSRRPEKEKLDGKKLSKTIIGYLLALGGAVGQAGGLVLSKKGMGNYDAFASTQIRIIAGIVGFAIIISLAKGWKKTFTGIKNIPAMKSIALGSLAGPFLGVSFSLIAIQHIETGVAATLSSLAPVVIIVPSIILFKEKIKFMEMVGAVISVIGVALFFW